MTFGTQAFLHRCLRPSLRRVRAWQIVEKRRQLCEQILVDDVAPTEDDSGASQFIASSGALQMPRAHDWDDGESHGAAALA